MSILVPKWPPRLPQLRIMSAQDASTTQGRAKLTPEELKQNEARFIGGWREDLKQKWAGGH